MRTRASLASLVVLAAIVPVALAQTLPTRADVISKMTRANDYFMRKWPDPGAPIVVGQWPSNIWTRATYYEGLLAFHAVAPNHAFYNYAVQWGDAHRWGLRSGTTTRNADDQCCGQSYIDLYRLDSKPERVRDIKATMDNLLAVPVDSDWSWIDAIQMAMPVLAKLAVLYNDSRYLDKMHAMYEYTRTRHGTNGLYNPADHLWWRDADFDPPYREPNGEDCYWSRGNGWVFAALVRVIDELPEYAPHRDEYVTVFKDMAAALKRVQRSDGFWNVSLHDPTNFGGPESSGTGFFTYGMAWGIRKGFLDRDTYLPVVIGGWNALANAALHDSGFIGYMQSTGKQPSDGQPVTYTRVPNFEDYGLGAFLLAGSEIVRLIDWPPPEPPSNQPRVANLSTRGRVSPAQNLIGGFAVRGTSAQRVLVRAIGPALQNYGVLGALANPRLHVYAERDRGWENGDWQGASQALTVDAELRVTSSQPYFNPLPLDAAAVQAGAFPLAAGSADAALVLELPPGNYTAHVSSTDGAGSGVALVEVYELPDGSSSRPRLINISSRCEVRGGGELMIAGFVVRGGPKKVLMRAVGPTLSGYGIASDVLLANPKLVLFNGAQQVLGENDDWGTVIGPPQQLAARTSAGAFTLPAASRDAEITAILGEGNYTVQVSGTSASATGVALVEIYEVP